MFRSRNKEHESNKNALPCLLDISVFVAYFGHFSAIPVGCRFAVSLYIFIGNYIYEREKQ